MLSNSERSVFGDVCERVSQSVSQLVIRILFRAFCWVQTARGVGVIIMTVLYCFDAMEARMHARTHTHITRVAGRSSGFIGVYHGRVRYANHAFQNSYTYVTVLSVICEFFFLIEVFSCCFGSRFCNARPCVRTLL